MEFVSWLDFHGFTQSKGWQLEHTEDELTVNSLDGTQNFRLSWEKRTERMTSLRNRLPRYADNSTYFFVPVGSDRKTREPTDTLSKFGWAFITLHLKQRPCILFAAVSNCVILSPENVFITLSPQKY